ncbi:protein kinase domain-containing protein [Prochlorothrix hollandica]|uniref:Protein kinase domain-containing protein n=1 Tax=Prochlorothrix hollandica PCC 9006 = CALU 1027 TaxID=317619 RepID=A0A0M2PYH4_PROHO|nr:hypothetical protein [Prochlorothrix hollandica]KKJ01215.1 hypothetical protein PROH_02185 [Prochlorothrix hollandica PCC 9006 = CALU 1027]
MTYSKGDVVYDYNSKPKVLGEIIGSGGQGNVYELEGSSFLVKIFHSERLKEEEENLVKKLETQIKMKGSIKQTNVSWPQVAVYSQDKSYLGYAMKKMCGIPLKYLAHPKLYEKKFPDITRENMIILMISLVDTISKLHELDIYLGDINLENILCNPKTWKISLIDADSYQIHDYPCPVGRPEMTPLEHHGKDFKYIIRTKESDCFSLAILIFQCFMFGRHPYDNIGGGNPVENLENGRFPYGPGGSAPGRDGAVPQGNWYNLWSHLSFNIKGLFMQTFKEGASNPESRASLDEWRRGLQQYLSNIKSDYFTNEVYPKFPKPREE